MHGDYSRGHEPDRKRGRSYRRVLLQQGRPVLDSDFASTVDAVLGEVRATARGLGCDAASPDLGYLVTPGRLLALFADAADRLTVTGGTPNAWIDYRYRYADRYPALYLAPTDAQPAHVTLPLFQQRDTAGVARAALWSRVEAATTIVVNGASVNLTPDGSGAPQRVEFDTGANTLDPLELEVPAGHEVWLFLLEQDEAAGTEPAFWVAPGTYHVDGLITDAHGGGAFPRISFPVAAGFPWDESPESSVPLDGLVAPALGSGARVVAYLETWERHITAVEDPGIREEALGSSDTAARTELLGQVKLATTTGSISPAAAKSAFGAVDLGSGRVTIDVPETTPTTDPCALPELAGYSGTDNRLYRVEVHRGGDLTQVQLKWSRDNGSELFAARVDSSKNLVFDPGTPLTAGDIVEVRSNVTDVGDDALATVSGGHFTPAQRAVGQIAQLQAVDVSASSDEVSFRLVELDDVSKQVALDDSYGTLPDAVLKLRRWHGFLDPQALGGSPPSVGEYVLEDGIAVTLSDTGAYRAGDYWQYEARVIGHNSNGPWRDRPHGPERRFAPLALLEYQGAGEPLKLVSWLDERFSHPCELDADDVEFDGERVGMVSDTVQEALEEIWERPIRVSTCTVTVSPGDDLVEAVAELPAEGGELCFQAGLYTLNAPLLVSGRQRVVVHGAGPATVVRATGVEAAFMFQNCTEIAVRTMRIEGGLAASAEVGEHLNGAITFVGGGDVAVSDCFVSCPDSNADSHGHVRLGQTCLTARGGGEPLRIRVERNRFEVGTNQTGVLIVDPAHAYVAGNAVRVAGARDLPTGRVADGGIVVAGGAVGTVEVLDNFVEQTMQGIHVAASGPAAGRESADAVLLSRNVVHARVPSAHKRARHAVFVGNARSVHVKDTIATLERTGSGAATPVDAIRLHGVFGPFVAVRQTSVKDFSIGVRVEPLDPLPSPRMWLVAETMADGAALGAEIPETVQGERNYPEHKVVATLTLLPALGTHAVGSPHTVTATARDATGHPITGVAIFFSVAGANAKGAQAVRTNSAGVATFSYAGAKSGMDTVSAFADSNDNGRRDPNEPLTVATVEFVSVTPTSVALGQSSASSLRGTTVTVTATVVTATGAPSPDARVVFSVTGANPKPLQAVMTDAAGHAVFTYSGPNVGHDTIQAFVDLNANDQIDIGEPQTTIGHDFTAPVPASVKLLPPSGNAVRGSGVAFTAAVLDAAGAPVQGAAIHFLVTGANPQSVTATTDANGNAAFQYTGANAGTDTIVAFFDADNDGALDATDPQARSTQVFTPPVDTRVIVPNLGGKLQTAVGSALTAAQLKLGTVQRLPDPPKPPPGEVLKPILRGPFVVDQSPAAGALVARQSAVDIVVQRDWFEGGNF